MVGVLAGAREVVEQAGQLDPAVHRALDDLGADAALAHQQALVDEFLDGPSGGGPRQRQALRQREFVLEAIARCQIAVADRGFDGLGELIVERNRAGPVEFNRYGHTYSDLGLLTTKQ